MRDCARARAEVADDPCAGRHDLAIAKIARGYSHDLDAVEDIHRHSPLDLAVLVERFRETYVTGSRTNFKISLQLAVERLFGTEAAAKLESELVR